MKKGKTVQGNTDAKEKSRALTPAEERRLRAFEELADRMTARGFRRVELTVGIVKANLFALLLLIPLLLAGVGLFLLKNGAAGVSFRRLNPLLFLVMLFVLIVVHELIHGLTWAVFAEHHWADIEFGFMKQYLTPYCTCRVPLTKGQYIVGALMPLFLLGVLPMLAGILLGSMSTLFMGIIMADSAAGDILIVRQILRYRSEAGSVVYIDHPTQAGGVIFEK